MDAGKAATIGAVATGWGGLAADILSLIPDAMSASVGRAAAALAVVSTGYLMLRRHAQPVEVAFDLGYWEARREVLREMNRPVVAPIRRVPHGLSELSMAARRINGHHNVLQK